MDCPCLLGRTLNGLTVLVRSPNGVNCFCLFVHLAACLFDSHAALYLFVSARICSPTPTLHPPILQTPALLETLPFISLAPPRAPSSVGQGSGYPSAQTGGTACPLFLACAVSDPHQVCCVSYSYLCPSLTVRAQ